jgi:Lipoprotein LpqB beta-propeller domain/Sporulation and spore germination
MRNAGLRVLAAAVALVLGGLLASACAAIPSSGTVESTPTPQAAGGAVADCCDMIMRGPQPGWSPQQVVENFLQASALVSNDYATAREYLTPEANKAWRPRSPVTILAQPPSVLCQACHLSGPNSQATVLVSGQPLATLQNGQYVPAAPGNNTRQSFTLKSINGRYYIDGLPDTIFHGNVKVSHALMLTKPFFHLVYTSRNLYYYAYSPRNDVLVPDPVFAPTASPQAAESLIKDLLQPSAGVLGMAAHTAFPPGARLLKFQVLAGPPGGRTALVNIRLSTGTASNSIKAMAEQLVATLTSDSYSAPLFKAVKLRINGRAWPPPAGSVQDLSDYSSSIPHCAPNATIYYPSAGGVQMLGAQAARARAAPGEAGTGRVPLGQVAVSPDGKYLAGISGSGSGDTVYTTDLVAAAKPNASVSDGSLRARLTGASLTALSWDSQDDLWVAGRIHGTSGVWVLPGGKGPKTQVRPPPGTGSVTALRFAPDGVRVALIRGEGASAHVVLAVAARNGTFFSLVHPIPLAPELTSVTALTWYDNDHLLAVAQSPVGTHLWEVPADGDSATALSGPTDITSITAAGRDNPLYLGLDTGRLEKSVGLGEPWTDVTEGHDVVYGCG